LNMVDMVRKMITTENQVDETRNTEHSKHYRGGKNRKHIWSDVYGRKTGIMMQIRSRKDMKYEQ